MSKNIQNNTVLELASAGNNGTEAGHGEAGEAAHGPLSQFEIKELFGFKIGDIDLAFSNSALYMVIATALSMLFLHFATKKRLLIPSKMQVVAESLYDFVRSMVIGSVGEEGEKFFPLVFSLFLFILLCNLLGLTPYSFTPTSQVAITLSLAMIAFTTVTVFAIYRNGIGGFFHMFLPSGVPLFMAPIIFLIEFFSFLIRPATLSIRLFANMVAGHVLLKVVAGFIISLGVVVGILPFLFSIIMTGFEIFVASLQASILAILVCAYLGDVTRAH